MTENPDYQVEPKYLTAEQCAVRFAISLRHFKTLVALGEMPPPLKFGKSSRWAIEILEEFESEKMLQLTDTTRTTDRRRKNGRK